MKHHTYIRPPAYLDLRADHKAAGLLPVPLTAKAALAVALVLSLTVVGFVLTLLGIV